MYNDSKPLRPVQLDGKHVSPNHAPFVIAEISANHRGELGLALDIVKAAAAAGADAIKLQHYTPDTITVRSPHPDFEISGGTLWDGRQRHDLYSEAMMPWSWTERIASTAIDLGMTWLSTPFDSSAVLFLEELHVPIYKIASFELIDLPLIRLVASKGKPIIMSTGMATLEEIDLAISAVQEVGNTEVILLRCNSGYPAVASEMSLSGITEMNERWGVPIGLSDHTIGLTAAVVAVSLGATVIEKHLTIDRSDGGPDAAFSAEPAEFAELVRAVKEAHQMLGKPRFGPSERELASIRFRPSLRAVQPIAVGEVLTTANVASIRPAGGLAPDFEKVVFGSRAVIEFQTGDPVVSGSFE
jgi:pseudaminic acid synthase